jgi:hypothetical protein
MCLWRAPEKYIAGAALDRADLTHLGGRADFMPFYLKSYIWTDAIS